MSTTHELPAGSGDLEQPAFPEPTPPPAASGVRGWLDRHAVQLFVGAAIVGVVGGGVAAWQATRPQARTTTTSAPFTLPATMSGLPAMASDPLHATSWQQKARAAVGSDSWAFRSYGTGGTARSIRVVAAHTDLTGKLEQAWAASTESQVGNVSCTHDTRLTPTSKARFRPTVLVCWRTGPALSAYALVIDPKATTPIADADGAAAVETAWKAAGGTD